MTTNSSNIEFAQALISSYKNKKIQEDLKKLSKEEFNTKYHVDLDSIKKVITTKIEKALSDEDVDFIGHWLDEDKFSKYNMIRLACQRIQNLTVQSIQYLFSNDSPHGEVIIQTKNKIALFDEYNKIFLKVAIDNSDDFIIVSTNEGFRLTFGVHNIWRE